MDGFGAFQVMTANEKDYVATRISHRLDLTGPSVSVHTACSTSLVAIHMAAQSLRNFECDLALAGGACVTVPANSGYVYNEGGMLSADGHCRPFDAQASGTIFSDGAAVVALRRLSDARRDGDRVYAILKGSAINNDGGRKASFTAPSAEGQARAIAAALVAADVPSDSIGYVEAHGTATPLGDPIEVAGLLRVYGPSSGGATCALGSIKSNFGHLTAAAGVTGFIKAVLAVGRGQLPPTLHFRSPNPAIDFGGRFHVVDRLLPWPRAAAPRRAAVSSMGVGGTNAHAIVEEPPAPPEVDAGRPREAIWLSARTEASLNTLGARLADYLRRNPDADLADVAFTLGRRRALSRRRAVIGANPAEVAASLTDGKAVLNGTAGEPPAVAFVFPGQGTQYPGMGGGLRDSEPTFRAAMDQCATILRAHLDVDLLDLLYGGPADERAAARLQETRYAQPALFVVEYALAQLFLSWGIRPAAMLGHSVGEFVAATLAGVFRLEDALGLVAARGRLMQSMSPGGMLSVRAAPAAVAGHLVPGAEIAVVNAPSLCVVAGPDDALAAVAARLEAASIPCKRLHTSHAFHTAMMDEAVPPFTEAVRAVPLSRPRIPLVSSATGQWMTDEQATDPVYWARHMRVSVQFAPALQTWLAGPSDVALELGPGGTLPALVRQVLTHVSPAAPLERVTVLPAMGATRDPASEQASLMRAVSGLWTRGAPVDGRGFWMHQRRRVVSLPQYPFDRNRYWIDPPGLSPSKDAGDGQPSSRDDSTTTRRDASGVPMQDESRRQEISQKVRTILEQASGLGLADADEALTFPELGVDSLVLTQAALTLKKAFGVDVTFRQLSGELGSIGAVVDHLDRPAARGGAGGRPAARGGASDPAGGRRRRAAAGGARRFTRAAVVRCPVGSHGAVGDSGAVRPAARRHGAPDRAPGRRARGGRRRGRAPARIRRQRRRPPPAGRGRAGAGQRSLRERRSGHRRARGRPGGGAQAVRRPGAHRSHPARDRYPAGEAGAVHQGVRRAHARLEGVHRREPPALRRSAHGVRLPSRHQGDHLSDRGRALEGRADVGRRWQRVHRSRLTASAPASSGTRPTSSTTRCGPSSSAGYEIGAQHPLAGEVARLICEMTGMERVAFCNTGSEAVMGAMRLARTVTGNAARCVMFTGAYHGIFDEVIVRGSTSGEVVPRRPGDPAARRSRTCWCWTTARREPRCARSATGHADELAAVLVEPVQSRRPELQPTRVPAGPARGHQADRHAR